MENMNMETTMEPIEAPVAENNYDVPTEVVSTGSPASGILGKVVVGGIVTAVTAGVVWLTSKGKKSYTTLPNQAIGGALVGKMTKK